MSTHITTTSDSSGSVEEVFAVLTSPGWPARKAAELHDGSAVVEREERPDGGVLLVVSRELPSSVPGFLERFLPADGRVVQTDDWGPASGGERHGSWSVALPGAPATLGGTLRLAPTAAGSSYTISGEVTVKVPLIAGKAERLIGEMVVKLAAKEADLLSRSLG